MPYSWKQFEKTLHHELRDEKLSQREEEALVTTASLLLVAEDKERPSEALLMRILDQAPLPIRTVTGQLSPRSPYRKEHHFLSPLVDFWDQLLGKRSLAFASLGTLAVIVLIIVSLAPFSSPDSNLVAENKSLEKEEALNIDRPSEETTLALTEEAGDASETIQREEASTLETTEQAVTPTKSSEKDNLDSNIDALLASLDDETALLADFGDDDTLSDLTSDINLLNQHYDEINL